MVDHFLYTAKAYAALAGAAVTAVIGVYGADTPKWVFAASAALTAVVTYAVPNKPLPTGKHEAR